MNGVAQSSFLLCVVCGLFAFRGVDAMSFCFVRLFCSDVGLMLCFVLFFLFFLTFSFIKTKRCRRKRGERRLKHK